MVHSPHVFDGREERSRELRCAQPDANGPGETPRPKSPCPLVGLSRAVLLKFDRLHSRRPSSSDFLGHIINASENERENERPIEETDSRDILKRQARPSCVPRYVPSSVITLPLYPSLALLHLGQDHFQDLAHPAHRAPLELVALPPTGSPISITPSY